VCGDVVTRIVALLLAGGRGRRLYPASRPDRPKQFLAPADGPSLLRRTADRTAFADEVYAVTVPEYAEAVGEEVPEAEVIIEPAARDTGPAMVYAAERIRDDIGDCVLVCLPTDHHIGGDPGPTLERAARAAAETDSIVTVGVKPERPETGYGYIEPGKRRPRGVGMRVRSFREKPDVETAERFVEAGHLWNAGIFAWTPETILGAARDSQLSGFVAGLTTGEAETAYERVPAVSIDEAVLEGADDVLVIPADFAWDDVGSWDALARVYGTDLAASSTRIDSPGTVVASDGPHISVIGAEDMVVAAYDGHILVVPRAAAQRVRELTDRIDP
jgi:mannose-1-phosphate guanylyltransferase